MYTGTSLQFSVSSTQAVTWSVNGIPGGNATVGTINATGLFTAPATAPDPSQVTVTAASQASSVSDSATVRIEKALRLFVVSIGGSGSQFLGYDIGGNSLIVSSTNYLFSEIIPDAFLWVVRDQYTSVSYASANVKAFKQDDRVFEVVVYSSQCPFSSALNPGGSSLTQFNLSYIVNDYGACDLNHVGIIGNNVYWRVPAYSDLFGISGGQFVLLSGGQSTVLLARTDTSNGATADIADNGTLYAVFHDSTSGTLNVWTRNLLNGKLGVLLSSFSTSRFEPMYKNWSFAISDGILYVVRTRISDNSWQILSTDLSVPSAPLGVLQTYPGTLGTFTGLWGVDNGRVVMAFWPAGTQVASAVIDFDVVTSTTRYLYLGPNTNIVSIVAVRM